MNKSKQCPNEINQLKLKSVSLIEDMLKAHDHFEKAGMINVYVCAKCNHEAIFTYLDIGVTSPVIPCPKCGKPEFYSSGLAGRQPDSVWYRPKDMDEINEIVDRAFDHIKNQMLKEDDTKIVSEKEMKLQIRKNYISHYNQGGLFAKKLILPKIKEDKDDKQD